MAPILFLFLMLAFTETLEEEYEKEWQVKPIEYRYHADENLGQLKSKNFNTEGLILKLTQLLYIDDSFFPFNTREDLIKGGNKIYFLFKKFGLLMHIGKGNDDSKTKAMYFPPTLPKKPTKKKDANDTMPATEK